LNPHRRAISDAESCWNGFNPLETGHEANISNREHDAPPQTMGKAAAHIIPPPWGGSADGLPLSPHRRSISDAGHYWNGPNPSEIGHEVNNPIRRHGASSLTIRGKVASHIIPLSPSRRVTGLESTTPCGQGGRSQRQSIKGNSQAITNNDDDNEDNKSLSITRPIDEDEGWNKHHHMVTPPQEQAQRSQVSDVDGNTLYNLNGSICDGTRQLGNATNICKIHNLAKKERMGRALQQFALLRRCFYPKRDVIKWRGKWNMRLSCEVSDIVQELLKRLPFEANSTCVELPCGGLEWQSRTYLGECAYATGRACAYLVCMSTRLKALLRFELRSDTRCLWCLAYPRSMTQYARRSCLHGVLLKYTISWPSNYVYFLDRIRIMYV
jgi:hypothetical protein